MRMLGLLLIFYTLPTLAQTMYYNHPTGTPVGPLYKGELAVVAKLTLPAGTYHAIFKSQFASISSLCATCGGPVWCYMYGTGIPNVTNPYLLDVGKITVADVPIYPPAAGNMTMQAAFYTNGGTVIVGCTDRDAGALQSARTSFSAMKISALNKRSFTPYHTPGANSGQSVLPTPFE